MSHVISWWYGIQWEPLPVVGAAAVVEHIAGAVRNNTGCGVGRELWGGSEVPGWRRTGPGEEECSHVAVLRSSDIPL